MKSKRGAFANSATGYSKRHNSHTNKSNNKSSKSPESTAAEKKCKNAEKAAEKPIVEDPDTDLNSGFGDYLRSNEGVEMMKIFIFANTVMVIVTMAWPHVKMQYFWFMEWLESYQQESY
ncbi:uncharacterized protein Xport-A [Calliphora vicina]|uniref:uncharacterized protein Xport-A n=1 Tax=Calliphora vicina TaxID=7373 RepID=UPI00325B5172